MTPEDLGDSPIVLDTGVFSLMISERQPYVRYTPFLADRLWVLSFATVAELRFGALKAGWGNKKCEDLEKRMKLCVVLPGGDEVSTAWAELNKKFADQIGVNDLWIAATALSQDPELPIATHDKTLEQVATKAGLTVICQH